jgi:very-short-patch-repair endonuclease
MHCTFTSIAGSAPDYARGARSAPRQSVRARHGGGVARSLRQGAASGALPAMGAQMRVRSPLISKSAARLELFAAQHRSSPTASEAALWSTLKARQLGVSFRRQAPVAGLFIADFLAPSIKLIVEVDGAVHARKLAADARRDRKLQRAGFLVVRVSAELVLTDFEGALALIRTAL